MVTYFQISRLEKAIQYSLETSEYILCIKNIKTNLDRLDLSSYALS